MKAAIVSTYFTIVLLAPSNVLSTKLSSHASIVQKGLSYRLIVSIRSILVLSGNQQILNKSILIKY